MSNVLISFNLTFLDTSKTFSTYCIGLKSRVLSTNYSVLGFLQVAIALGQNVN